MPPTPPKRIRSADRDISPPPAKRRVTATTTTPRAVSNFFTPASQKGPETVTFHICDESLLIARCHQARAVTKARPVKVAAFDWDDTLIATRSGNRFAKGADDWKWWHARVPGKLKELDAAGYAVVVMSNQAAVSLRANPKAPKDGMRSLNNLKGKMTAVLTALDLPITVYAATAHDRYRKPRTGMWERMLADYGLRDAGDIDHAQCLFVGDAAGREADKAAGVKKDHSCSDRDFAANVAIPFHTPEEFFLGHTAKPFTRPFDPASYVDGPALTTPAADHSTPVTFAPKHDVEMVLFCGSPGAGKSTFYWQHLQPLGYARVNQDTLKTRDKCMKAATEFVEAGQRVAVDNTNADVDTRAAWVRLAQKLKAPIRLVHFTALAKLCEHNDTVRALTGDLMNPEKRTMLPKMAFTGFAARYREPTAEEGFEDITNVDFQFDGSDEQKAVWRRFWVS